MEMNRSEHHDEVLHTQINLVTKFEPNLSILIFKTKFEQKGVSGQKDKKETSPLHSIYSNYPEHQI